MVQLVIQQRVTRPLHERPKTINRNAYTDRRPFALYTPAQDTRCPACYQNEEHTIGQHNRAVAAFLKADRAFAEQDYAAEVRENARIAQAERDYQRAVLNEDGPADLQANWQKWYNAADADIINAY